MIISYEELINSPDEANIKLAYYGYVEGGSLSEVDFVSDLFGVCWRKWEEESNPSLGCGVFGLGGMDGFGGINLGHPLGVDFELNLLAGQKGWLSLVKFMPCLGYDKRICDVYFPSILNSIFQEYKISYYNITSKKERLKRQVSNKEMKDMLEVEKERKKDLLIGKLIPLLKAFCLKTVREQAKSLLYELKL